VGDFDVAVDLAADLGKVARHLIPVRRRPSLSERLFLRFAGTAPEDFVTAAESLLSRRIYYRS